MDIQEQETAREPHAEATGTSRSWNRPVLRKLEASSAEIGPGTHTDGADFPSS